MIETDQDTLSTASKNYQDTLGSTDAVDLHTLLTRERRRTEELRWALRRACDIADSAADAFESTGYDDDNKTPAVKADIALLRKVGLP